MTERQDECDELLQQIQETPNSVSEAGKIIIQINEMLKKPSIEDDLTKVLNSYQDQLKTSEVFLSNGVFNTNFAEGALILQAGTALYAKKVDMLWDLVIAHLERNMQYEDKTESNADEFTKIEERKQRFKRKRKIKPPISIEEQAKKSNNKESKIPSSEIERIMGLEQESDEFQSNLPNGSLLSNWTTDPYSLLKSGYICPILVPEKDLNFERKFEPIYNPVPFKICSLDIYQEDEEGDRERLFNLDEQSWHIWDEIELRRLHRLREILHFPEEDIRRNDVLELISDEFLLGHNIPIKMVYEEFDNFLDCYQEYHRETQERIRRKLEALAKKVCPRRTSIVLERLPEEIVNRYLVEVEEDEITVEVEVTVRKTLDARSDVDSGFFEHHDDLDSSFHHSEADKSHPQTPCELLTNIKEEHAYVLNDSGISDTSLNQTHENNTTIEEPVAVVQCKQKRKIVHDDDDDENVSKKVRKPRFKFRPTITTTLKLFERFYFQNYSYDASDCIPDMPVFEDSDGDDNCDDLPIIIGDDEQIQPTVETSKDTNTQASSNEVPTTSNEVPSTSNQMPSTSNEIPSTSVQEMEEDLEQEPDPTDVRNMDYNEWREHVEYQMKVASKDFDIHEEGDKIIETIGEVDKTINYGEICNGKSAKDVTRSFIAMLQLANTYNVEIIDPTPGCISNDTLQLKLLSKERHHENLLDYNAPSEVTFRDRLDKAQDMAKKRQNTATHSQQSSKKSRTH